MIKKRRENTKFESVTHFIVVLFVLFIFIPIISQKPHSILEDSSYLLFEEQIKDANLVGDTASIIDISAKKIKLLESYGMYDKAISIALDLDEKICSKPYFQQTYCSSCYKIGDIIFDFMWKIENYHSCLNYAQQSYYSTCIKPERMNQTSFKLAKTVKEIYGQDSAAVILKNNYHNILTHDNSQDYVVIHSLNNIGVFYRGINQNDSALVYYKKAISLIDQIGESFNIEYVIYGNIGVCYLANNQIDSALYYISKDAEGSKSFKNKSSYINAETAIAEIESEHIDINKGYNRIHSLYNEYHDEMDYLQRENSLKLIITNSLLLNKDATPYFDELLEVTELQEKEDQDRFHKLSQTYSNILLKNVTEFHQFEKEINQKKIALLEKDKAVQYQRSILILSLITSALIISLVLFFRYRSVQRSRIQLIEQDKIIQEKNAEILQLQVEKNQEDINQLALELTQKNDLADKIGDRISEIDGIKKSEVTQVKFFIRNELELKSTRSKLQEDINKISEQFLDNIRIKHPDLTDNDLKLTAMIVLNQSNKEIALHKSITEGSVKVSKNRLKKKLNLPTNADLTEYLQSFK